MLDTIGQQAVDVMIIDSLHNDHVDLDWAKTQISCAFQPVENAVQNILAGDLLVRVAIQSQCRERADQAFYFVKIEPMLRYFEIPEAFRDTVTATQVATVGDRQS